MLPDSTIARIILNVTGASAPPTAFDTGLILAPCVNFTEDKRLSAYTSAAEALEGLTAMGYAETDMICRSAVRYFAAASPPPARLLVSLAPVSQSYSAALDAVIERDPAFYGVFLTDSIANNIHNLAEHIENHTKPMMLFAPIHGNPTECAAEGSLLERLCLAGYRRTLPVYVPDATYAAGVMGLAMGLTRNTPDSAFALIYKTVGGMPAEDLTAAQVDALEALNGNVHIARGGSRPFLEKGSTASGTRYTEVLYTDRIGEELRAAARSLITDSPEALPQTDDTSARFINRFAAILAEYRARGILVPALWRGRSIGPVAEREILPGGFALWADSYDRQSDADRAAHKAMPIHAALTMAGSVESVVLSVDVTL